MHGLKLVACVLLLLCCVKTYAQNNNHQGNDNVKKLQKYIGNNVRYPAVARENQIYGRVIASFNIDADKKIAAAKVIRNLYPACDKEVLRVLQTYPVKIDLPPNTYTVVVNFSLEGEDKKLTSLSPLNAYLLKNFLFEVDEISYPPVRKADWIIDRWDSIPQGTGFRGKIKYADITIKDKDNYVSHLLLKYNKDGTLLNKRTYGTDNKLTRTNHVRYFKDGSLAIIDTNYYYDGRGHVRLSQYDIHHCKISDSTFDLKGIFKSHTVYGYDTRHRLIKKAQYNAANAPTNHTWYVYNNKNQIIERRDTSFNPAQITKIVYQYNLAGDKIEEDHYDKDTSLTYKMLYQYDKQHHHIDDRLYTPQDTLLYKDTFIYNKYGDNTEILKSQTNNSTGEKIIYQYSAYDKKGNWHQLVTVNNNQQGFTITRKFGY